MDFTGVTMVDFALAGTAKADEFVGPQRITTCCRCGHQIANVFIVDVPAANRLLPMGGDCLATLTGDNSTRRLFSKVMRALPGYDFTFLQVIGDTLWAKTTIRIIEWSGEAVTRDRAVACGNPAILKAAAVHYLETVGRSYNFKN